MAIHKGIRIHQYLDDWLVRARSLQTCHQHTQELVKMCQDLGWLVNMEKSELEPKQVFNFVGYQLDLRSSTKDTSFFVITALSGPTVYVPDRPANSHGKTSSSRPITHETHTVASQEQLEGTRIPREGHPSTQIPAPTFTMVARGKKRASRPTITPRKACSANIYRRIKRRVGRSLKRAHCKGILVGTRKQAAHKLSRTQSSVSSPQRVPRSLRRQNSSSSNRQYYSGCLHKQGRRHEVGSAMCPTVENLDLVFPATSNCESSTHPRPFKCDSRQTIQAGSDHPDGVVPPSRSFSADM